MPNPNDNLNDLPFPPFVVPELDAPIIAGNVDVDEGALQEFSTRDNAEPPTVDQKEKFASQYIPDKQPYKPITRLMTYNLEMQSTWQSMLLIPADPNRISLTLYAFSETATNWIRFSDDSGKVQVLSACAKLYSGQLLQFPESTHTGPIWVYAPDIVTSPCNVVAIAITC